MSDEDRVRIWARLDELKELLTKVLTVQVEREKACLRNERCISQLKDRVRLLEINQGKWSALAAMISAVLTAGAVKFFVG